MSRANIDYIAYFNGEWLPLREVRIDPMDSGFTVGDVVFDLARTFNGKSFRMKEHVDRLWRSLKFVRIDPGMSADDMIDLSEEALRRNEHLRGESEDLTVRQFVTRGIEGRPRSPGPPTVGIIVQHVQFSGFAHFYETGAHGIIVRTRSHHAQTIDPKLKHYSRLNFNLADLEAADVDPDGYPILMDMDGYLTEGTGYNLCMVTDGVIRRRRTRRSCKGYLAAWCSSWRTSLALRPSKRTCSPTTSIRRTRRSSPARLPACCQSPGQTTGRSATAGPAQSSSSSWRHGAKRLAWT